MIADATRLKTNRLRAQGVIFAGFPLFENMKYAAVFYMVALHVLQSTFYLGRGLRWGLNARRHVDRRSSGPMVTVP